jgi:NADH-quinone oxidoreductase subunit N
MAIAVKAAAFGIFVRVLAGLGVLMPSVGMEGEPLSAAVWVLAFVTLVLGNLLALAQDDLKRLLAYSGIAHSGYILVGLAAATRVSELAGAGVTGALFYLAGYTVTTAGVFCVITMLREDGRDIETVSDLKGLAKERPGAALCLTICLLSLVGMPPTVGFLGKLWVFKAAIEARFVGLVVAASVATMISIYYYLRPIVLMYTGESEGRPVTRSTLGANVALVTATALTLLFGILPAWIYEYADLGAVSLIGGF